MADARVGDVGFQIKVQVKEAGAAVDISGASSASFLVTKPGDTSATTWAATFLTDGVDGWLQYATVSGDLSAAGDYVCDVSLAGLGGWTGKSATSFAFNVRG